ncbi:hypothetical protein LIA77_07184 [Sarocladium implicatum]|nr:hypothetical protein LIA77_07184 [Sarocladium implicatum]
MAKHLWPQHYGHWPLIVGSDKAAPFTDRKSGDNGLARGPFPSSCWAGGRVGSIVGSAKFHVNRLKNLPILPISWIGDKGPWEGIESCTGASGGFAPSSMNLLSIFRGLLVQALSD